MSRSRKTLLIILLMILAISAAVFFAMKPLIGKGFGDRVQAREGLILQNGEKVEISCLRSQLVYIDDDTYVILIKTPDSERHSFIIPVTGYTSGMVSSLTDTGEDDGTVSIRGTVVQTTDELRTRVADTYSDKAQNYLPVIRESYDEYIEEGYYTQEEIDLIISTLEHRASDEGHLEVMENMTDYTISAYDTTPFVIARIIAAIAGFITVIVLIYALLGIKIKGKHLALGTVILILTAVLAAAFILRKDIATMMSLKEYAPGLYMARMSHDYKLDEIIGYEATSESEVLNAVSQELFFHVPLSVNLDTFGCSSFSATTPDGTHILGRNFDLTPTSGTVIYATPENGYRSIGVCDMSVVNLAGEDAVSDVDSAIGRLYCRAFPYITFDGMNEAGLGISILSISDDPSHPDTDKPDIYMLTAIRAILDTCADVDEAVTLLDSYDVHSMAFMNYHLFITDRNGDSVVAEWIENEMNIIRTTYVTNFYLSDPDAPHDCDRYDRLEEVLGEKNGILTIDEAMTLLSEAAQYDDSSVATRWSCVYDLDNFRLYIVSGRDWNNVYEITPDSF
ncbi:MAG: linear amide C-N hydrolase [Clostridiales bacterium]|nr:linear amide C-N hydrolase [Clostridiales bacterium]